MTKGSRFGKWEEPIIEHGVPTKWNWVVLYPEKLTMGFGTDVGAFCLLNAKNHIYLGKHVQIGSHSVINSISTVDGREGSVTIHDHAKIGSHCAVFPGVTIGEGAVVGAGALVNKDIPTGATVFGWPVNKCMVFGQKLGF